MLERMDVSGIQRFPPVVKTPIRPTILTDYPFVGPEYTLRYGAGLSTYDLAQLSRGSCDHTDLSRIFGFGCQLPIRFPCSLKYNISFPIATKIVRLVPKSEQTLKFTRQPQKVC